MKNIKFFIIFSILFGCTTQTNAMLTGKMKKMLGTGVRSIHIMELGKELLGRFSPFKASALEVAKPLEVVQQGVSSVVNQTVSSGSSKVAKEVTKQGISPVIGKVVSYNSSVFEDSLLVDSVRFFLGYSLVLGGVYSYYRLFGKSRLPEEKQAMSTPSASGAHENSVQFSYKVGENSHALEKILVVEYSKKLQKFKRDIFLQTIAQFPFKAEDARIFARSLPKPLKAGKRTIVEEISVSPDGKPQISADRMILHKVLLDLGFVDEFKFSKVTSLDVKTAEGLVELSKVKENMQFDPVVAVSAKPIESTETVQVEGKDSKSKKS